MRKCKACDNRYHNTCHDWSLVEGTRYICQDCHAKRVLNNSKEYKKTKSININSNVNNKNNNNNSNSSDRKNSTSIVDKNKSKNIVNNSKNDEGNMNSTSRDGDNVKKSDASNTKLSNTAANNADIHDKTDYNNNITVDLNTDITSTEESLKHSLAASTPAVSSVKNTNNKNYIASNSTVDLSSLRYCTLPSSMLELFSTQFNLLERAVRDAINRGSASAPLAENAIDRLVERVSSLEEKIGEQTSKLDDLHNDRLLLLQENKILKEQLTDVVDKIKIVVDGASSRHGSDGGSSLNTNTKNCNININNNNNNNPSEDTEANLSRVFVSLREVDTTACDKDYDAIPKETTIFNVNNNNVISSNNLISNKDKSSNKDNILNGTQMQHRRRRAGGPRPAKADNSGLSRYCSHAESSSRGEASSEVVISNVCDGSDAMRTDVVQAILTTIDPSVTRDDLVSIRLLRPAFQRKDGLAASSSVHYRSPWVVCLSHRKIVENIMRAKGKLTAFNTKHINVTLLNEETRESLIQSKIFINEFLDKDNFARFNNLKQIARGLSFKYI